MKGALHAVFRRRSEPARPWLPEYARTVSAHWLDAHRVRIENIRCFRYRTRDDYTANWFDAVYDVDLLESVDLVVSRWAGESIAHVFVSFGFADGDYLSISIETRRREGQHYSTWKGFLPNYDLMYVVADEADLIGVRTDVRRERVCLYRGNVTSSAARKLFIDYLARLNELNAQPEHYHTLFNNCTTNILRHVRAVAPHFRYDWRILLSGHADAYGYRMALLDQRTPFVELKRASLIHRSPDAVIDDVFSRTIREPIRLSAA